jgi:hypothetical protein
MELMKSARKHGSLVSEVVYILLNVGLAVGVLALVRLFPDLPVLAYLFVILSKWRVLAVRPRFWWDNFQANFLDLLLGVSVVTMLWQAREVFVLQLIIASLYGVWLIVIKPMTTRLAMQTQAAIAQFVAITALLSTSFAWPSWSVVLGMWVIGYVSARHTLVAYEEDDVTFLSLIWGLIVAELGWVAYHWTIAYSFGSSESIFKIPQLAITIALLGYLVGHSYSVFKTKGKLKLNDVIWPALFALGTIVVLLTLFNSLDPSNS